MQHIYEKIFTIIFVLLSMRPWPNPNKGKIPSQYAFNSRSLRSLTILHNE